MKTSVVVGRKWNNPQIEITVAVEGIEIEMSISDFLKALAAEMGNPALMVTSAQLEAKLTISAEKVISSMKLESEKVM